MQLSVKLFWFGSNKKWVCNWSAQTNWFGPIPDMGFGLLI